MSRCSELHAEFSDLQEMINKYINDTNWEKALEYSYKLCNKLNDFYGNTASSELASARHQLGFIHMKLDDWNSAIDIFDDVISMKTELFNSGLIDIKSLNYTIYNYGVSSFNIKNYEDTINAFQLIIETGDYITTTTPITYENRNDAIAQVYMLCNLALAYKRVNDESECFKYVELIRNHLGNINDFAVSSECNNAILECIGVEE